MHKELITNYDCLRSKLKLLGLGELCEIKSSMRSRAARSCSRPDADSWEALLRS